MAEHRFQLRATFVYGGEDNRTEELSAEILTDAGWNALDLNLSSPGFLIFVYSFLVCQHTYFHANCTESGLLLDRAHLELLLVAGDDWRIGRVAVEIKSVLRGGKADRKTVDHIESRMRQCPVSINLREPADYRIELEFS